ncbi:heat shock protein GrpE [Corynebacterium ciconiae DSM 44920]|uniref:nucleotide exchange factor GrpE n=1 Tax=Corynebacterium ciconiae TaxID=227319 RepID=UPI00037DF687|nr:nucleotide exchange factor GrpE [Corynebacterium ciconiae]WKD62064.1 heat shock protein GrpE [Corynebacterium ciconiae DSM 44920]
MTHPGEMPDNPGDPDATDEANYSPNEAEAAAAGAAAADAEAGTAGDGEVIDPLDEEINELLDEEAALADAEATEAAEEAEAEADARAAESEELAAEAEDSSQAQIAELTEDLKRVSAEYANYRRRTEREREGVISTATVKVLKDLLPILDDLDMAEQHGDLEQGPLKTFAEKFRRTVNGVGLKRFGETGDEFDPSIHEAIQDASTGEEKALGTVVRPGYQYKDTVVRAAMVIIDDPVEDQE